MGVRTASTTTTSRPSSLCIGMAGLPCVGCAPGGFGAAATHTRPRCGTLPPPLTDESTPLPERLGVVGSGTIACGLAKVAAEAGDVVLYARSDQSADRARGRLGDCGAEVVTDLDALSAATYVVEAVVEEHDAKAETYAGLDPLLADDAILASSTSSLSVTSLAEASGRPDRFAGFHVFNPVERMQLIELVFPEWASEATRERVRTLSDALGKTGVEVPDTPGFVVNRLLFPYLFDAVQLMEETRLEPSAIDACMRFG